MLATSSIVRARQGRVNGARELANGERFNDNWNMKLAGNPLMVLSDWLAGKAFKQYRKEDYL